MKVKIVINATGMTKEDMRALLQAIRDCEMATFPDKKIYVSAEVPELSTDEMTEILTSIRPPYNYGPVIFKYSEEELPIRLDEGMISEVTICGKFMTGTTIDDEEKATQVTKALLLSKLKEASCLKPTDLFQFQLESIKVDRL